MPSITRYYSSTAAKTTLSSSIDSSTTSNSITLAAASGLPSQYPFTLILEKDTANEEIVEVTGKVGTAYTVTRGIDGSTSKSHSVGAAVEHGVSARDFSDSRSHEASTNAHGITGDVVGTGGAQTLTSKTLTTATLGSDLAAGGYKITGLATPTSTSDAATKGYIDTSVNSAALSASSAATSASSAATSASSALTSQGSAAVSASSAATSATAAATSAASAATSATAAATSAASALTSQTAAATSAASALTSQTAAATSATSAAASATAAATSATSAAASATTAAASVATIAGYATTASNSAATATTSASQAATSAASAAASATAAATSATNAAASATTASNSAATATTSASQAATSASSAATSATAAAGSATTASASAATATTSAAQAATSATSAAASATAAATSAASAATSATSSATSAALAASIVAGAIQGTLFDAKGDLLVGTANDAVSRLGVGTNGYLLTADSAEATGVKWAAAPVSLPTQTGNTGKALVTDGSTASWSGAVPVAQTTEPSTLIDGLIWVDTDGTAPTTVVTRWSKQPAAGTTSLSGNDDNNVPLSYSAGYEQVFLNGTLLSRANDYTATSGTSITLTTGTVAGDIVEVICPLQISTTDTYTQTAANSVFVAKSENNVAGKNAVINGGMDIWQRGTSFTSVAATLTYTSDRWYYARSATGMTISRQTTSDTTNLPNIQYCSRIARDSGNTSTEVIRIIQSMETVNSIPFIGKTVTLSFYARKGANYSDVSSSLVAQVLTGTGTDQNINSISGAAYPVNGSATLTTTWQRFSFTGTTSSSGTQLHILFYGTPVGTAGANDYFEITGVQLELGSVATAFSRAGGTLQGELAACQRYYERSGVLTTAPGSAGSLGEMWFPNGTIANGETYQNPRFAVTKRTAPTVTTYSYNGTSSRAANDSGTDYGADSANVWRANETGFVIKNNSGSSLTVTSVRWIYCNWAASAEL